MKNTPDGPTPFHPANKNPLGEWVITRFLIQPAASRAFAGVHVYAQPDALKLREKKDLPVIYCVTHTSWWDGYMVGLLNRTVFKQDAYLMMEEVNLARYWFFTWIGVFGVDRDDARKALASIDYSVRLLTEQQGRAIWVFPQGTITHPDTRPMGLFSGAGHIARRVGRCALVPVALRYEFRMEQAPQVFAYVGNPLMLDPKAAHLSSKEITSRLEEAMTQGDDAVHADLVSENLEAYRTVLGGRGSSNALWDGLIKAASRVKKTLRGT